MIRNSFKVLWYKILVRISSDERLIESKRGYGCRSWKCTKKYFSREIPTETYMELCFGEFVIGHEWAAYPFYLGCPKYGKAACHVICSTALQLVMDSILQVISPCYFFLPDDLGVGTDLEVDEPTFMELRVGAGFPPCKVVALFAEEWAVGGDLFPEDFPKLWLLSPGLFRESC